MNRPPTSKIHHLGIDTPTPHAPKMVYRGRPSKACERCRRRRLKCDLEPGTCGQCIRAHSTCSGYRNTDQIRIENETSFVATRVSRIASTEPRYLPLQIDTQAQEAFFSHYVSSSCWEFLRPYFHPLDAPNPWTLAMEAASLAFFWHQVYSETALVAARQRYTLALRMASHLLRSHAEAIKDTTLLTTLLLDVYEKITTAQDGKGTTSHINGALALVKLRGLEHFKEPSQIKILERLEHNCVVTSITTGLQASKTLVTIREYLENLDNGSNSMASISTTVSNTMMQYARLRCDFRSGNISKDEVYRVAKVLEDRFQRCEDEMPTSLAFTTHILEQKSERVFHLYYHSYVNQRVCAARNMLRVARINLNEWLLEHHPTSTESDGSDCATLAKAAAAAHDKIVALTHEILASVPVYTDCNGIRLSQARCTASGVVWDGHPHTPRHQADCYQLLFPLYAAGRARARAGTEVKRWVLAQMRYMAGHFHLREAAAVARILEGDEDVCPWEVHAMLGSYAFNA